MTTISSSTGGVPATRSLITPVPPRARAAAPADPLAPPPGPDWVRMRYAVRRYRWFILFATGACMALGIWMTQVVRPVYTADTMLWIDGGTRGEGAAAGPVRPRQVFDAEAWTSLLRSYSVLEGAVHDAQLFVTTHRRDASAFRSRIQLAPSFVAAQYQMKMDDDGARWTLRRLSAGPGIVTQTGVPGDTVGGPFGFAWIPSETALRPGREIRFTITPPRQVATELREALAVRVGEQANFLGIELAGTDPERLTATLNAVGARFVAQAAALKQQNLGAYSSILAEQVASAHAELVAADRALEQFRTRYATVPRDMEAVRGTPSAPPAVAGNAASGPQGDVYAELVVALESSRRDRTALDAAIASGLNGGLVIPVIQRIALLEQDAELADAIAELTVKRNELRALRYRYEDSHPGVQRLLGEVSTLERVTIPPLARAASQRMAARESTIATRVASTAATLRGIPIRDREEGQLTRRSQLAGQLYESLQVRYDGTRLAEASAVAEIRVLDHAVVPAVPTKDSQPAILLFSLVGGLLMTGGLAIVLDRSDKRFRYPDQVSKDLGLTILGAVPHVRTGNLALVRPRISTPFQEAMRDLRLSLAYAHGHTGPLHLTVTSPGGSDGKSFVAAQLARVFAEGGARTLLIDGDLRRGLLNERFNHPRRPGLSEYLRGAQGKDGIIQHTVIDGLDLVTSGGRHRDASELLGGNLLPRLLADVHHDYDVVICDSPPLSAGVDAVLLGAATGTLLLVVRTGVSLREVAASRLEVIRRLPIRVIGAVLNDVPKDSAHSYYTHYALPGYESRMEDDPVTADAK